MNNRPLVYMYDDVNQDVVTPNKLLFGRNLPISGNVDESGCELNLSKRLKYIDTLLNQWWRRFSTNYLTELHEHQKCMSKSRSAVVEIHKNSIQKDIP